MVDLPLRGSTLIDSAISEEVIVIFFRFNVNARKRGFSDNNTIENCWELIIRFVRSM